MESDTIVAQDWAGIVDKLMAKGEKGIIWLSDAISNIAPDLWEIMIKQVFVDAFLDAFVSVGLLLFFGITFIMFRKWKVDETYYGGEIKPKYCVKIVFSYITGLISAVTFFVSLYNVGYLICVYINPKYYAIKEIMRLIQ